jgi:hypothetical protein
MAVLGNGAEIYMDLKSEVDNADLEDAFAS